VEFSTAHFIYGIVIAGHEATARTDRLRVRGVPREN
jgi:hypothetical protein